jgi:hypothetical protein
MSSWNRPPVLMAMLAVAWAAACGSSSNPSANFAEPGGAGSNAGSGGSTTAAGGAQGGGNANTGAAGGSSGGPAALPAEMKVESDYQSPVSTGRIVWTANPMSGRVAYVDATTFNVQTVQAGDGPTYLAAVPSADPTIEQAIVINVGSQNATLLRYDSSPPDGGASLTPTSFPSTADANAWAISASGKWAIAWTDFTQLTSVDPTQGFQDIAVLDLASTETAMLSVGYRPSQIAFSNDESRAFVVTQDGISVIDLQGAQPAVSQLLPLSAPSAPSPADASVPEGAAPDGAAADASVPEGAAADASVPDGSEAQASGDSNAPTLDASSPEPSPAQSAPTSTMPDVSFTPDGAYALVRLDGVAAITIISLLDGTPTQVPLASAPTDLTVAPDGTFAVAVLRDSATVVVLPLPAIVTDPSSRTTTAIPGATIGRAIVAENLTTKQTSILLFTTAAPIDELTVLTLQPSPSVRAIPLYSPVLAVFPTADGQNAIVLHNVTPTVGSSVEGAFSLVPIAQDLPAKIISLTAPPTAVALSPAGDRALVTYRDDATSTYGADLAMMPSLQVLPYTLASPPTAAGIAAAAGQGFVAQDYTDGRITFIDLDAGGVRTITGFELSANVVVEGQNP